MVSSVNISDNDGNSTIVQAWVSLICTVVIVNLICTVMIVSLIPYSPKLFVLSSYTTI